MIRMPEIDFRNLGMYEGKKIEIFTRADAPLRGFDFEHGSNVAKMAAVLLSHEEAAITGTYPVDNKDLQVDTAHNQRVMWLAAFFSDIGRTKTIQFADEGCASRSADMFQCIMQQYPELSAEAPDATELILQSGLPLSASQRREQAPLLVQVLLDAKLLDESRHSPNTSCASARLEILWGVNGEGFFLPFSKLQSTRDAMMKYAGWQ